MGVGGAVWHVGQKRTSLTLILAFAEVSKNAHWLNTFAKLAPCVLATTRSSSRSHLFPTRTSGTCSVDEGNPEGRSGVV